VAGAPDRSLGSSGNGRRRLWFQRCAAALLVPLALLLGVEGVLRLTGYGYPPAFFLKGRAQGQAVLLNNPKYGWRFFGPALARDCWPFTLAADKSPETFRVFVLGESAAMGDPDPRFGLSRMLEALLSQRLPDRRVEVVNTAFSAINSHVILPIARECALHEGDLWVIYMGNNEVEGPFGTGSVFGRRLPPVSSVRASLMLKSYRLGQLLDAAVRGWDGESSAPKEWGGMEMLLENKVRQGDPQLERIYDRFRNNLQDILEAGRRAGVPVVLCTVGANLHDCSPFASLHDESLSPARLGEWDADYQSGVALQNQGDLDGALIHYRKALLIDPGYADLWYRMASCLEALGQGAEAADCYRQALDTDVLRFRADTRLNQIVRESAEAQSDVRLFDAEALLERHGQGSPPGREFFFDHVHLTPTGNYLLARGIAEAASSMLQLIPGSIQETNVHPGKPASAPGTEGASVSRSRAELSEGSWPSESQCLQWLGLTDRNRVSLLSKILRRRASPPFSDQLSHAAEVRRLQGLMVGYRDATSPAAMTRMAEELAGLVVSRPDDADLRSNYAAMLQAVGDLAGSEREWLQIIQLLPHAVQARLGLGLLLEQQGRPEAAAAKYRECLRLSPVQLQARQRLKGLSQPPLH